MRARRRRAGAATFLASIALATGVVAALPSAAHAAGEYDNPSQGLQAATGQERSPLDLDGDGLPQRLEFALARQFMPTVWFHELEGCAEPAGNRNHAPGDRPGQLVFRASRHPANPEAISLQYDLLYARDCGTYISGTLGRHNGDVEPFSITVTPNPACQNGYGIYSVRTWAHEGTFAEHVDTDIHTGQCRWGFSKYAVNHDRPDGRIAASLQKHGNYLNLNLCKLEFATSNDCKKGWTAADVNLWTGLNVGEQARPLASTLDVLGFPRERVWARQPFCGNLGLTPSCPGPIEDKFKLHAPEPLRSTGVTVLADGFGRASAYVVRARADGSQSVESLDGGVRMGPDGDRVFLVLYGDGVGSPNVADVTANVGGLTARATYAGPSGYAGIEQVNLELPRELASLHGDLQLQLRVGTKASSLVKVPFA